MACRFVHRQRMFGLNQLENLVLGTVLNLILTSCLASHFHTSLSQSRAWQVSSGHWKCLFCPQKTQILGQQKQVPWWVPQGKCILWSLRDTSCWTLLTLLWKALLKLQDIFKPISKCPSTKRNDKLRLRFSFKP